MKIFVFIFSFLMTFLVYSQFTDDFTDGDFTNNPFWNGDETEFLVIEGKLRSNGPAESAVLHLSTPSEAIEDASWSFLVELGFTPSASNRVKVYLVSDSQDLEGALNGYFVEIGQAGDDQIKFYRQDGSNSELLFTGSTSFSGNVNVRILVTRDIDGQWSVSSDPAGGNTMNSEGSPFEDNTYTASSFFGIVSIHTSTRKDLFFFDDFVVTGTAETDRTSPTIQFATAISANEVEVVFSESIDQVTAEDTGNYSINQGITVSTALRTEPNTVTLTTSELVNGQDYILTVNNVEDENGNAIEANNPVNFQYLVISEPAFREVVINEIFSNQGDDNPYSNDYIELFNVTDDKFFDMQNWTLEDNNKEPDEFESFILRPGSYLIISRDTSEFSNQLNRMEVSIDNFNNADDHAVLRNSNNDLIDSVGYETTEDGISIEQINPTISFFLTSNYGESMDPEGGTPGVQNSIFDDTPDTASPVVVAFAVISGAALQLTFSEPLAQATAEDPLNFTLSTGVVSSALLDASNLRITLSVSDLFANTANQLTVRNIQDLFGNVMDQEIFEFTYYETETAISGDLVINEFLTDPIESNDDFVELYNRSDKFISLEGWTLSDESSTSPSLDYFVMAPDSYLIIYDEDALTDYSIFGEALTIPSLTLNNDDDLIEIKDNLGNTIAYLEYGTIVEEAVSLELINPDHPCISFVSYNFSTDQSGFTPGKINSVFDNTADTTPPTVTTYGYDEALMINFSEVMNGVSLLEITNYDSDDLSIDSIIVSGDFLTKVEIHFNEAIRPGDVYEVLVRGVLDCAGNVLEQTTISFAFGRKPIFNELIITEILFNEDPAIGLPAREYVEIFNASDDVISTAGLSLIDATNTVDFPVVNLNPGAYYVVTSASGVSEFEVNSIGMNGFPSLNNSGELLVLSLGDTLINSVAYDPDWHNEEKAGGGYSLEMVDVTNPCLENPANWRSSADPSGGTPGEPNSIVEIIPDNMGPEVVAITAISTDTIQIDFNEKMNPSSIKTAKLTFQPSLRVSSVFMKLKVPSSIFIRIDRNLESNLLYSVDLSEVFDCSGNEAKAPDLVFALPLQARSNEIKLSEVLFNPRTNGVDFVEIYNDSENYISLKNWQLARITDVGIADEKVISTEELVIDPKAYLVFTTEANVLLSNYPKGQSSQFVEMPALPPYANDTGNVVLFNSINEVMEQFFYDEDYHYDLLESVDGVSLERISFSNPTNSPSNWRSASSTEGFATPGYHNSQSVTIEPSLAKIKIDPKVFIPGNSASGRDFTTINYQFDTPGQFANVNIYDQNGRLVKNLVQGELLATSGFLRWDGETNSGTMARLGYYIVLFEVFDTEGNTEVIKKTVVVGRDF